METLQSIDPMRYGIIDLGTNTFKLLVADVVKGGVIQPVMSDEIGVKLAITLNRNCQNSWEK